MADNFDAVDIIYSALDSIEISAWKDKSPEDTKVEHIVVNSPSAGPSSYGTNDVSVNVNIFVPPAPNGMINRARFKALMTAVSSGIESADTSGYYCAIDPEFSGLLEKAKKGFDCFTIRFLLTLNK